MRVAITTAYFPPHPGGQERHVYDLAMGLSEMGHEVTVLTSDLLDGRSTPSGAFDVVKLHAKPVVSDTCVAGIGRALRDVRPDLIHLHSPLTIISLQTVLSRPRAPMVATYHGDFYKARWASRMFKCLRNHWQLPFVLKGARRVIALSRFDMGLLERYGVDPGKIGLIYPGLDPGFYRPDGPKTNPTYRILFVGRTVYEKGMKELVEAFCQVCGINKAVELHIAGTGNALDDMRVLCRDLGIADRVHFHGWVHHDRLVRLYQQSTMVVLPSFSEGLPYSAIEAMLTGTPLISTNVSGMGELVTDGENGLLYDVDDPGGLTRAILRLLEDPEERARMGRSARETCSARFTKDRWLKETVETYAEVL